MRSHMYREQHKAIRSLVAELPTSASGIDADAARATLARLSGALKAHLKLEDERMYPDMLTNGTPEVKKKAKGFQDEMGGLAGAFLAFNDAWSTPGAIAGDAPGFVTAWAKVKSALADRMDREDRELYAMLDELANA